MLRVGNLLLTRRVGLAVPLARGAERSEVISRQGRLKLPRGTSESPKTTAQ